MIWANISTNISAICVHYIGARAATGAPTERARGSGLSARLRGVRRASPTKFADEPCRGPTSVADRRRSWVDARLRSNNIYTYDISSAVAVCSVDPHRVAVGILRPLIVL